MSLVECICCPKHHLRTAVVWDELSANPVCFFTYSHILTEAETVAKVLSSKITSDAPIAVYGRNCPHILAAILAIMLLRTHEESVGGVACLPVNLSEVPSEQERCLVRCGVELALVEISTLEV